MDYPPFQEAVVRFRSFLNDQGLRGPIGWIFPSDVCLVAGGWVIRPRLQEIVLEEIATAYQQAFSRRLGVQFGVLCLEGEVAWSYIFCPTDQTEALRCMMPDGLKLSVPTSPDKARKVKNDGEWKRLQSQEKLENKLWRFE
jgi:hypothetical protein